MGEVLLGWDPDVWQFHLSKKGSCTSGRVSVVFSLQKLFACLFSTFLQIVHTFYPIYHAKQVEKEMGLYCSSTF